MPRSMRAMRRRAMRMDGRNPYGSEGGYVVSRRARGDRLMMEDMRRYNRGESDYELGEMTEQWQDIRHDPYMPRDYETGEVYAGLNDFYGEEDMARNRRERDMARRRNDYARQGGQMGGYGSRANYESNYMNDGHYPMVQGYMPIEAMGRFTGYYGMGEDYARGNRGSDYGYDMARGRRRVRDYARYGRRNYGRDYGYDYESGMLGQEELMEWSEKLKKELEDKDKQFFSKENIKKKAEEMGIKFDKFSMEEFYVTVLMVYTDYCKTLGTANMDIYLRLAKDWLEDDDVEVKGSEKLATYHDYIVEGDDD